MEEHDFKDPFGYTALHLAVWNMHADLVKVLLDITRTSVLTESRDGWTCLHFAVWNDDVKIIRCLLNAIPAVSIPAWIGSAVIRLAAERGQINTVKALIDAGIDASSVMESYRMGTIRETAHGCYTDAIRTLMEAGVDPSDPGGSATVRAIITSPPTFSRLDAAIIAPHSANVFMPIVEQVIPGGSPPQRLQELPNSQPKVLQEVRGIADFNFLTCIGRGNFAKVMLAEVKGSRQLYAIKVFKKDFLVENDEVQATKIEEQVFRVVTKDRHPFLLNLHYCFQTTNRLYFVMEYVAGGNLIFRIQQSSFLPSQAQYLLFIMCLI